MMDKSYKGEGHSTQDFHTYEFKMSITYVVESCFRNHLFLVHTEFYLEKYVTERTVYEFYQGHTLRSFSAPIFLSSSSYKINFPS